MIGRQIDRRRSIMSDLLAGSGARAMPRMAKARMVRRQAHLPLCHRHQLQQQQSSYRTVPLLLLNSPPFAARDTNRNGSASSAASQSHTVATATAAGTNTHSAPYPSSNSGSSGAAATGPQLFQASAWRLPISGVAGPAGVV